MKDGYAATIYESLINLFQDEEERTPCAQLDLENIDATMFFTDAIKALALLYNKLTNDDKDYLEFTYLANHLIFHYAVEEAKKEK
jgi:hypothetical protein